MGAGVFTYTFTPKDDPYMEFTIYGVYVICVYHTLSGPGLDISVFNLVYRYRWKSKVLSAVLFFVFVCFNGSREPIFLSIKSCQRMRFRGGMSFITITQHIVRVHRAL